MSTTEPDVDISYLTQLSVAVLIDDVDNQVSVEGIFDEHEEAYEYCVGHSGQHRRCFAVPASAQLIDGRLVITSEKLPTPNREAATA